MKIEVRTATNDVTGKMVRRIVINGDIIENLDQGFILSQQAEGKIVGMDDAAVHFIMANVDELWEQPLTIPLEPRPPGKPPGTPGHGPGGNPDHGPDIRGLEAWPDIQWPENPGDPVLLAPPGSSPPPVTTVTVGQAITALIALADSLRPPTVS